MTRLGGCDPNDFILIDPDSSEQCQRIDTSRIWDPGSEATLYLSYSLDENHAELAPVVEMAECRS